MIRRLMGRYLKRTTPVTVTRMPLTHTTPLIKETPRGNDRNGAFPLRNSEGLTFAAARQLRDATAAEARMKRIQEEACAAWLEEKGVTFFGPE